PRPPSCTPFPYTTLFRSNTGLKAVAFALAALDLLLAGFVLLQLSSTPVALPATVLSADSAGTGQTVTSITPTLPNTTTPSVSIRSEEHTSELQSRENLVC